MRNPEQRKTGWLTDSKGLCVLLKKTWNDTDAARCQKQIWFLILYCSTERYVHCLYAYTCIQLPGVYSFRICWPHGLGGHVTPHNPIRIQCQVHGKVFQFQVFYQSKTTSATGKVSLPAEKLASSSHLMMNHLLERFPTCQVMCFHPLPQPPMDAVLEATENNKWRDGCQSYRKSGILYHLGFWIGFFLLYYLCYLYRGGYCINHNLYIFESIYIYVHR